MDFNNRSLGLEIMDDLNCSGEVVDQTLRELEFINRWLGGNQVTVEGIRKLLKLHQPGREISITDLGCGSGDMLRLIADWGKKNNIAMRLIGVDANPHIINFASIHLSGYPGLTFETTNVFSPEFRTRKFDIITATLFTHHFSDDEVADLLNSLWRQAKIGIVVNDIHRHWFAYYSIGILTKLFSRSSMVKFDAPLSVLRAFRRNELEVILARAGIQHYNLRWKWAFRWQLIIPAKEIGPSLA